MRETGILVREAVIEWTALRRFFSPCISHGKLLPLMLQQEKKMVSGMREGERVSGRSSFEFMLLLPVAYVLLLPDCRV